MLRENNYILRQINLAVDLSISVGAFVAAHYTREFLVPYVDRLNPAPIGHYAWILYFLPVVTVGVLAYNGLYVSQRFQSRISSLIGRVLISCVEIGILMNAMVFLFWRSFAGEGGKSDLVSRPLLMLIPIMLFVMLSIKTYLMRSTLMRLREKGYNFRRVVMVGSGKPLTQFIEHLEEHPIWGLKIVGIITDRPDELEKKKGKKSPKSYGYPLIGDLNNGADALEAIQVDEVVMTPHVAPMARLAPLMDSCEEMGIRTHLPLHQFMGPIAKPALDHFDDVPVISYWPTRQIGPALLCKYVFDRFAGAILLVLSTPMYLAAVVGIKLTSPRGAPVFFSQERCGLNGRVFRLWKFRTMVVDAESRRKELEAMNEADGPAFKIQKDPRITPFGRILRKFSIDEMPQLWNVVRGEMSLVGPRPPLPGEVKQYDRWQRRRLSMKPGMTCLWQVSGRSRVSFDHWMKLDLDYIDNWSLLLDFKILVRTFLVVITGHGAM